MLLVNLAFSGQTTLSFVHIYTKGRLLRRVGPCETADGLLLLICLLAVSCDTIRLHS